MAIDTASLIQRLLDEADAFEDELAEWQQPDGKQPTSSEVRRVQRAYGEWYSKAKKYILDEDRDRFEDMYNGGEFTQRIRAFLADPLAVSPFYDPSQPNPLVDKWQHPFKRTFRDNLLIQRQILINALHGETDIAPILDSLSEVLRRLPSYLGCLKRANSENVSAPTISNEADLQVVVHSVLSLLFADVRAEDPVPKSAGGSSRVDFLLRQVGVVVETKMTRAGLKDRQVGEELLVDWGRYPKHPDCKAILGVVYDPGRYLDNPAAIEHDLSSSTTTLVTRVIVIH